MNNKKIAIIIFALAILCFLISVFIDDSSVDSKECKSCGTIYEAGDSNDNYMNITKTGMCNRCYENYMFFTDF